MTQPYYKRRDLATAASNGDNPLVADGNDPDPLEVDNTPVNIELDDINEAAQKIGDTVAHKDPPEPLTPDEEEPVVVAPVSPVDKAKAFLKEWWWAVAIAAYVAYKLWKGEKQ